MKPIELYFHVVHVMFIMPCKLILSLIFVEERLIQNQIKAFEQEFHVVPFACHYLIQDFALH